MQGKSEDEKDSDDSVCHGGLDDHEDDGIISARIVLAQYPLQFVSHGEQTVCHKNSVDHSESHLDAEINELGIKIIKCGAGARLHLDDDREPCSNAHQ